MQWSRYYYHGWWFQRVTIAARIYYEEVSEITTYGKSTVFAFDHAYEMLACMPYVESPPLNAHATAFSKARSGFVVFLSSSIRYVFTSDKIKATWHMYITTKILSVGSFLSIHIPYVY